MDFLKALKKLQVDGKNRIYREIWLNEEYRPKDGPPRYICVNSENVFVTYEYCYSANVYIGTGWGDRPSSIDDYLADDWVCEEDT